MPANPHMGSMYDLSSFTCIPGPIHKIGESSGALLDGENTRMSLYCAIFLSWLKKHRAPYSEKLMDGIKAVRASKLPSKSSLVSVTFDTGSPTCTTHARNRVSSANALSIFSSTDNSDIFLLNVSLITVIEAPKARHTRAAVLGVCVGKTNHGTDWGYFDSSDPFCTIHCKSTRNAAV